MPYLDKAYTSQVRQELKKTFPEFRFSVRTIDSHKLQVVVSSGPLDLLNGIPSYESVNPYYTDRHYENQPEKRDFIDGVLSIMKRDYTDCVYTDGDYGNIPSFYLSLSIGSWEKPYIQK
jgi:hypothetical protein